jgi:hypothetical protein
MSDQEAESLDQEDKPTESTTLTNEGFKSLMSIDKGKELARKASVEGIKRGLSEIEYGEVEYEEQSMPDDIIKMSIFVSINQTYFYE